MIAVVFGNGSGCLGSGGDAGSWLGILLARGRNVDIPIFAQEVVADVLDFMVFMASFLGAADVGSGVVKVGLMLSYAGNGPGFK